MKTEDIFGWAGFFVALGVLATPALTAYKLLKAGTVGSMSITFFLFVFMNCVNMTSYGLLTDNIQLILCNIYGICSATFAIQTFLSLLRAKELVKMQQKAVVGIMGANFTSPSSIIVKNFSLEGSPNAKNPNPPPPPAATPEASVVATDGTSNATVATSGPNEYVAVRKQTLLFLGGDLAVIGLVLLFTFFGYSKAATSLCGFAATAMGTIMFSGPLDQIGWIVKHKSSAPLEPMIMVAAAANSICWGAYGLVTLDGWLIFPNACGLTLAGIQAFLLFRYPRQQASAHARSAFDQIHAGRAPPTEADLQRVIDNAREDADRPRYVAT